MRESKAQFIKRRIPYHMDILRERHPDAPDRALDFWAEDAAEKEWRTGRVYSEPVCIEQGTVHVYDPKAKFGSGSADGVNLRFNPGGPMVSVMSLSYGELRELVSEGLAVLRATGEWISELDDPDVVG